MPTSITTPISALSPGLAKKAWMICLYSTTATSAHATRNTSIRTRKIRGEDSLVSSTSMAERDEGGILISVAGTGLEPHYGTAVAGKKLGFGTSGRRLTRNRMPCLRVVHWAGTYPVVGYAIPYDHGVPLGAAGDRAVAVRPDGLGLPGAAAHRQFRLGRHHLDVRGRAGRGGERAVADRGRRTQRAARTGRGAGCDLVVAARPAHRGSYGP